MSAIGGARLTHKDDRTVRFEAEVVSLPIGKDDIADAQREAGYHPAGYGGPWDLQYDRDENRKPLRVRWSCAASCD